MWTPGRLWTTAALRDRSLPSVRCVDEGLRVETTALREVSAALSRVDVQLQAAQGATALPPQACGHDGLRERLEHVGAGWDRRRRETVALVAGLARAAHDAAVAYEGADLGLAALLGVRR